MTCVECDAGIRAESNDALTNKDLLRPRRRGGSFMTVTRSFLLDVYY